MDKDQKFSAFIMKQSEEIMKKIVKADIMVSFENLSDYVCPVLEARNICRVGNNWVVGDRGMQKL